MRKQTKLVAVLSAAALLAIGASMTSFAAQGWTEEDGTWVYLDNDGYRVTDSWKKSGNFWYYLDEDGYMATSKLIEYGDSNDNIYYVDDTGKMVSNQWVQLENPDYYDGGDDEEAEMVWYYFQNSGKAYKTTNDTSWKTINGKKYAFDENGHMLWGWVDHDGVRAKGDEGYKTGYFYCGDADDGARVTNDWRYLYVGTENHSDNDSEDDTFWFYFGANGEKIYTDGTTNAGKGPEDFKWKTKKINGKTYSFDEYGIMQTKWSESTAATASWVDGYFSTSEDGSRKKGWFKAVPSEKIHSEAYNDDSEKWFYAENSGKLVVSELKNINGKKYAFNAKGEMLSGLWSMSVVAGKIQGDPVEIKDEDQVLNIHTISDPIYYFGGSDDGSMKTGSQNVEVDGEKYQFCFSKKGDDKGQGITAVQSNVLYVNGKRIKADSDYRYQVVQADGQVVPVSGSAAYDVDGGDYLINSSGSVMSGSGTYTDTDGRQFKVAKREGTKMYDIRFIGYRK